MGSIVTCKMQATSTPALQEQRELEKKLALSKHQLAKVDQQTMNWKQGNL